MNSLKKSLETEIKRLKTTNPFDEFKEKFCKQVETLNNLLKNTDFELKETIDSDCWKASDYKTLKKIGRKLSIFAHPDKHSSNSITGELSTNVTEAITPLLTMIQNIKNISN